MRKTVEASGKYRILQEIEGGMNAYAYKAKHIPLAKEVFLKVYDHIDSDSTLFQEPRYLMEATDGDVPNRYIVKIYDAEKVDKYILVSMEFVQGPSLLELISQSSLGLMDSVEIAKKILLGLSALHTKKLLHRDLKPANIMIVESCGIFIPRISDFGSAKRLDENAGFVTASKHSALYVPPEGWESNQYGIISDIYQVGIILFEMINGSLPYDDFHYLDSHGKAEIKQMGYGHIDELDAVERSMLIDRCISRRSRSSKIISTKGFSATCPAKVKKIIKKSTHHKASERYESISCFLGALSEINLPNWKTVEDGYLAQSWKGFDWIVEKNKNLWSVKRVRSGSSSYRHWKTDSLDVLFKEINAQ